MTTADVTVLGGGNTAFAVAAKLTLDGYRVMLGELPGFAWSIAPILESKTISLAGVTQTGTAKLFGVTTNLAEAIGAADTLLVIIPSYGHQAFAEACAPHLRSGQTIVLMPGNLGSLEFRQLLKKHKAPSNLILAETDTAPFVCRKVSPTSAHIWGIAQGMGLATLPSAALSEVHKTVSRWFPGLETHPNVLACGLSAMNPVVHPAGILMNAGRIEKSRGEFYFYDEGVSPGVCRVVEQIDRERLAIGAALGVALRPAAEGFHHAGFGPKGDLWSTINGSRMLTQLRAPGSLDSRWITEDVPYGLGTWIALAEACGIACPNMRAIVRLCSALLGRDFETEVRDLNRLGLAGMSASEILQNVL